MQTLAKVLADPNSNTSRLIAKASARMQENEKAVAAWMTLGYTREEAWAQALA